MPNLLLASSSAPRKMLMDRLQISYSCYSPDIDETPFEHESAQELVMRLARQKAEKAQTAYPEHVIISADQVASCENTIYGKPHDYNTAFKHLKEMNGKTVIFHNGIHIQHFNKGETLYVTTEILYKNNTDAQIKSYIDKEQPFKAAGSFKSEGLSCALIAAVKSTDPTAILGLPLIHLCDKLAQFGIHILAE